MTDYNRELLIGLREKAKLGSKTLQLLLTTFGSIEDIIGADIDQLICLPRMTVEKAEAIISVENYLDGIIGDLEMYRQSGIETMTIFDDNYPHLLKELADPPFVLYYKGNFPLDEKLYIAMIGTTKASNEGIRVSVAYASELVKKGAVIVSGLARGIDSAAHMGAIKANGKTYAVLGCGLANIYPSDNKLLSEEIIKNGALISEYPPYSKVSTGKLISRNRIIVGLSHSVVIGELDKKSRGTIDAADRAKDMGKLLFAIGDEQYPVDPGLIDYGAIPLEDMNKADLIVDHSF
jgi:DNA processing protein